MIPRSSRRLQSTNLEAKGEYLIRLHSYLDKHNVFKRLTDLEKADPPSWDKAEKLDKDITRGMLLSENIADTEAEIRGLQSLVKHV